MTNFSDIHPSLKPKKGQWANKRIRYVLKQLGFRTPAKLWGLKIIPPARRMNKHWLRSVYMETYEAEEASAALALFDMGLPVIELGGGFGAVALAINRNLERPEEHVVVDLDPDMIYYLVKNRELNGARYRVVHGAVGKGELWADHDKHFIGQNLSRGGANLVPTLSLHEIINFNPKLQCNLLMDIEGEEAKLIMENADFLRHHVKILVLELHGHKANRESIAGIPLMLHKLGFCAVWQRKNVWGFSKKGEVANLA